MTIDDYAEIVKNGRHLIDLRAPVEFAKGSFPDTVNLPLMDDREREMVGTEYKKRGNEAALALGHSLVSGRKREERIRKWVEEIEKRPDSYIFCWRGGQRSAIVQKWIEEASGIRVPRIEGGYKAFRNFLMSSGLEIAQRNDILIIGGRTGCGKTILLSRIPDSIDLEGLAGHRGSAFGRYAYPQPTQISFENALYYEMLGVDDLSTGRIVIEDESRNIGQRYIPPEIFSIFQRGEVVILEASLEERVEISYRNYVLDSQKEYAQALEDGICPYDWYETMLHNFGRIRKRLGDARYRKFTAMFEDAWRYQKRTSDPSAHKEWISALLSEYYDPMYDFQIEKKRDRIVFRGDAKEVEEYILSKRQSPHTPSIRR